MTYFKLILIAILFVSCVDDEQSGDSSSSSQTTNSSSDSTVNSQSKSLAECISGTYSGRGDFTMNALGDAFYKLEVGTNGPDLILLATALENNSDTKTGQHVCSILKNISFEDKEEYFRLTSESVEHKGGIGDTYGFYSTLSMYPSGECNLRNLLIERRIYSKNGKVLNAGATGLENISKITDAVSELAQTRSFDEIKEDCDKTSVANSAYSVQQIIPSKPNDSEDIEDILKRAETMNPNF